MNTHAVLRAFRICVLGCLFVISSIEFYVQPHAPSIVIFHGLYHILHGESLDPTGDRPFPKGEFQYNQSEKVDTGEKGPAVYARVVSLRIADDATQIAVVFDFPKSQPPPQLSVFAPEPTIHVGGQVFPARSVLSDDQPGAEMKYRFDFAPVTLLSDTVVGLHLNERATQSFTLSNPAPRIVYWEETGPNVWVALVVFSGIGLMVFARAGRSSARTAKATLLEEWRAIDDERQKAAERFGVSNTSAAKAERHKAAQESLNRAEELLMRSYGDRLRAELWTPWVISAVIMLCLSAILPMTPLLTHITYPLADRRTAGFSRGQLSERVQALEQDHTKLFLLLAGILACSLGIAANIGLSMWRTKSIARKKIRTHLDEFDSSLRAELLAKLEPAERSIRDGSFLCSEINRQVEALHGRLVQRYEFSKDALADTVDSELLSVRNLVEADFTRSAKKRGGADKGVQT